MTSALGGEGVTLNVTIVLTSDLDSEKGGQKIAKIMQTSFMNGPLLLMHEVFAMNGALLYPLGSFLLASLTSPPPHPGCFCMQCTCE